MSKISSTSYGQFWYGKNVGFPGFLYKKNVGVGGRRSTKMNPGANTCCITNKFYNKYTPGSQGIGASSISNRRAKNRLATVCQPNGEKFQCLSSYMSLGQYSHNPNGFVPLNILIR